MTIFHDQFPILLQIFSHQGQKRIPESCADDGVDAEFGQVHPSHSRRQGNQMPYHGDESADKDGDASSLLEEVFRALQFFLIEKEIFSEFSDERLASIISDRIRQQRSDDASHRAD